MEIENKIRQPAVAGQFYPASAGELSQTLREFFANVPKNSDERILKAVIVPHAGYIYSGQVAAFAYARVRNFKKVILLGPSHYVYLDGIAADTHAVWQTPLGQVKVLENDFEKSAEAHEQEHCLEVQVPFLQTVLSDFSILPLVAGQIEPAAASARLQPLLDEETLLVISSDLSHYHSYEEAVRLDRQTIKAIESLNPDDMNEACGEMPIRIVLEMAKAQGWKPEVLMYKNSGDVTGDKTKVVGYVSVAFYDK